MELHRLKYFAVVAEELNFTRAAERLNIAQPPLSQQIHQLEAELGVELFKRTKRQVILTTTGRVFLKSVYKIFDDIEKAYDIAQRTHRGEVGVITVGFTGTAMFEILPNLIQSCRKSFPLVDLSVHQLSTTDQVHSLLKGEIDVGLLCAPVDNPELNSVIIQEEPFVVAVPENHRLASESAPVEVRELSRDLFIMTPRKAGQIYYDTIINICHTSGFSPNIAQEAYELHTSISLVASGIGIALVPYSIQNLRLKGVAYCQLKNPVAAIKTALAWREDETSPLVYTLVALAKKNIHI